MNIDHALDLRQGTKLRERVRLRPTDRPDDGHVPRRVISTGLSLPDEGPFARGHELLAGRKIRAIAHKGLRIKRRCGPGV